MNARTKRRMQRRVIEMELPTDNPRRPARGDWSRWEAAARRQLAASARRIEAAR